MTVASFSVRREREPEKCAFLSQHFDVHTIALITSVLIWLVVSDTGPSFLAKFIAKFTAVARQDLLRLSGYVTVQSGPSATLTLTLVPIFDLHVCYPSASVNGLAWSDKIVIKHALLVFQAVPEQCGSTIAVTATATQQSLSGAYKAPDISLAKKIMRILLIGQNGRSWFFHLHEHLPGFFVQ